MMMNIHKILWNFSLLRTHYQQCLSASANWLGLWCRGAQQNGTLQIWIICMLNKTCKSHSTCPYTIVQTDERKATLLLWQCIKTRFLKLRTKMQATRVWFENKRLRNCQVFQVHKEPEWFMSLRFSQPHFKTKLKFKQPFHRSNSLPKANYYFDILVVDFYIYLFSKKWLPRNARLLSYR